MTQRPNVIFDTSAINKLANDPEFTFLFAGIKTAFFARVTETNIAEIVSTEDFEERRRLLTATRNLITEGECILPFHLIVEKAVKIACWVEASVHVTVVDGHGEETETLNTAVLVEIESLRRATLADLREKYREVFHEEARSRHREHLFRRIAWRLQALAEGDLSTRARVRADQIAQDADLRMVAPRDFFTVGGEHVETTQGNRNRRDSRLPLPGSLLTRKWKGRTLLVEVLAKGFRYENRHYPSLSAIAVEITGTRWNGLAFFGLTRAPGPKGRRAKR